MLRISFKKLAERKLRVLYARLLSFLDKLLFMFLRIAQWIKTYLKRKSPEVVIPAAPILQQEVKREKNPEIERARKAAFLELRNLYHIFKRPYNREFALLGQKPYSNRLLNVVLSKGVLQKIKNYTSQEDRDVYNLYVPAVTERSLATLQYQAKGGIIVVEKFIVMYMPPHFQLHSTLLHQLIMEKEKGNREIRFADDILYKNKGRDHHPGRLKRHLEALLQERNEADSSADTKSEAKGNEQGLDGVDAVDPHDAAMWYNHRGIERTIREIVTIYKIIKTSEGQRFLLQEANKIKYLVVRSKMSTETAFRIYQPSFGFGTVGFAKLTLDEKKVLWLDAIGVRPFSDQSYINKLLFRSIKEEALKREKTLKVQQDVELPDGDKKLSGHSLLEEIKQCTVFKYEPVPNDNP